MLMPNRKHSASNAYRYGFNGQEQDLETNKDGNLYNAEYWEYDSRIGRRWNIDPIPKTMVSPYVVLGNSPILYVDPNGADWYKNKKGEIKHMEGDGKHKGWKNITGKWIESTSGNKYYYGHDKDDITVQSKNSELEPVIVTAKTKKWKTIHWFDGSIQLSNLDLRTNSMIYGNVLNGKTKLEDAMKNGSFAWDYNNNRSGLIKHIQAERTYRIWSYSAVAVLTGPFILMAAAETGAVSFVYQHYNEKAL